MRFLGTLDRLIISLNNGNASATRVTMMIERHVSTLECFMRRQDCEELSGCAASRSA